jgi:ribosome modulation factor
MTTKREARQEAAYQEGRRAADAGRCGHSPYDSADPGWAWIGGYEERMGELGSPAVRIFCWRCEQLGDPQRAAT